MEESVGGLHDLQKLRLQRFDCSAQFFSVAPLPAPLPAPPWQAASGLLSCVGPFVSALRRLPCLYGLSIFLCPLVPQTDDQEAPSSSPASGRSPLLQAIEGIASLRELDLKPTTPLGKGRQELRHEGLEYLRLADGTVPSVVLTCPQLRRCLLQLGALDFASLFAGLCHGCPLLAELQIQANSSASAPGATLPWLARVLAALPLLRSLTVEIFDEQLNGGGTSPRRK